MRFEQSVSGEWGLTDEATAAIQNLDVPWAHKAAQEDGNPFMDSFSETTGQDMTADEIALMTLHKLRCNWRIGTDAQLLASDGWLRSRGFFLGGVGTRFEQDVSGGWRLTEEATAAVRNLDVPWAQGMAAENGIPFKDSVSEITGQPMTADEIALMSLHQMRIRLGSNDEKAASKEWLRGRGLYGLFGELL